MSFEINRITFNYENREPNFSGERICHSHMHLDRYKTSTQDMDRWSLYLLYLQVCGCKEYFKQAYEKRPMAKMAIAEDKILKTAIRERLIKAYEFDKLETKKSI
jgi:hypothetical protein